MHPRALGDDNSAPHVLTGVIIGILVLVTIVIFGLVVMYLFWRQRARHVAVDHEMVSHSTAHSSAGSIDEVPDSLSKNSVRRDLSVDSGLGSQRAYEEEKACESLLVEDDTYDPYETYEPHVPSTFRYNLNKPLPKLIHHREPPPCLPPLQRVSSILLPFLSRNRSRSSITPTSTHSRPSTSGKSKTPSRPGNANAPEISSNLDTTYDNDTAGLSACPSALRKGSNFALAPIRIPSMKSSQFHGLEAADLPDFSPSGPSVFSPALASSVAEGSRCGSGYSTLPGYSLSRSPSYRPQSESNTAVSRIYSLPWRQSTADSVRSHRRASDPRRARKDSSPPPVPKIPSAIRRLPSLPIGPRAMAKPSLPRKIPPVYHSIEVTQSPSTSADSQTLIFPNHSHPTERSPPSTGWASSPFDGPERNLSSDGSTPHSSQPLLSVPSTAEFFSPWSSPPAHTAEQYSPPTRSDSYNPHPNVPPLSFSILKKERDRNFNATRSRTATEPWAHSESSHSQSTHTVIELVQR